MKSAEPLSDCFVERNEKLCEWKIVEMKIQPLGIEILVEGI
jgi:hypothetical protein